MGYGGYSCDTRALRSSSMGYTTKSVDEIFTQQKERRVHESMKSQGVTLRECRDSEENPETFPVIIALDLTGSMGMIPHELIKDGLPKLMSKIIEQGGVDISLLFIGVGDSTCDRFPLQVGQFEKSDELLDMWLTRTYLEKGGGGNAGESYLLAWEFAANHTVTDAWEKRGKKGILFTIGDEPNLKNISARELKEVYGDSNVSQGSVSAEDLLKSAREKWEVVHIDVRHGYRNRDNGWTDTLGQDCIVCEDYTKVPEIIADIVIDRAASQVISKPSVKVKPTEVVSEKVPEML